MTIDRLMGAVSLLSPDALVELYTLDTTPLHQANGVTLHGAQIYYWTPGLVDQRTDGALPAGASQTATILTLDQEIPLIPGRPYKIALAVDPDAVANAAPSPEPEVGTIIEFGTTTFYGNIVTWVRLHDPLTAAPAAGTRYTLFGTRGVSFAGNTYNPMPIEVQGFELAGQGKIPRPVLRVSNLGGLAAALAISNGDLLGAMVTRIRTLRQFLDDGENPDSTSFTEPEIFTVDRLATMTKDYLEFELAAQLDQQGKRLPGRVVLRDSCDLIYRQYVTNAADGSAPGFVAGTCPYAGSAMFDVVGNTVSDPAADICGQKLIDCAARFGAGANLPFGGFPGVSVTR